MTTNQGSSDSVHDIDYEVQATNKVSTVEGDDNAVFMLNCNEIDAGPNIVEKTNTLTNNFNLK